MILSCLLATPAFAQADAPAEADTPAVGDAAEAVQAPAVSAEDSEKAKTLFEAGRKLYFQSEYAKAIASLKEAVGTDSTKSHYKLLLAKAYRESDKSDEAVEMLSSILKDNPEHVEAGVAIAELLDPKKQPEKVIATLQPLLKFKHDYPLYHLLAEAYYEREELDKARESFEKAVKLNPRAGGDFYQLGNIYLSQGRFARAAQSYERAGELGINSDVYHFKLASVYFNLRIYLGRINTATVVGGKVGEIKNSLLLIDAVPGQENTFYVASPKSAAYQVRLAQLMGIDVPGIRFLEANIWLSARRYAKADAIYSELEEKVADEEKGLYWYYRSQTALGLGEYKMYLERLNKAIEAEPKVYESTLSEAYVTVAQRYQQRGKHAEHIKYLTKAVNLNPLSASLHLALGDAHWQLGDREDAIEQYKLTLELEPNHAERVRLLNRIRGEEDVPVAPPRAGGE